MNIDIVVKNIDECQYSCMKNLNVSTNCCLPVLSGLLGSEEAAQVATLFRVLGEPARLRLISLIAAQPSQEACVCELTEPLNLSQPTVSHHLKVLYGVGLLDKERRGNWIYYHLVPQRIEAIRQALAALES